MPTPAGSHQLAYTQSHKASPRLFLELVFVMDAFVMDLGSGLAQGGEEGNLHVAMALQNGSQTAPGPQRQTQGHPAVASRDAFIQQSSTAWAKVIRAQKKKSKHIAPTAAATRNADAAHIQCILRNPTKIDVDGKVVQGAKLTESSMH